MELQGKLIAFIGDWSTTNHPHPISLPEHNAWEWKTAHIVKDAVAVTFFAAPKNTKEVWKPMGLPHAPESLPRMVYLPTQVAAFALECPRTPWQLFQFVGNLIHEASENGPTEADASLLWDWLLGGSQYEVGKNTVAWVLDLTPVVSTDSAFMEWCHLHIST